jgi:hypothetical protein
VAQRSYQFVYLVGGGVGREATQPGVANYYFDDDGRYVDVMVEIVVFMAEAVVFTVEAIVELVVVSVIRLRHPKFKEKLVVSSVR